MYLDVIKRKSMLSVCFERQGKVFLEHTNTQLFIPFTRQIDLFHSTLYRSQ